MMMKTEPILGIFMLIFVMFFTACAKETAKTGTVYSSTEIKQSEAKTPSNPVIKKAEPALSMCPDVPKILRSTSKFIKIDHAMSQFEEANKIAVSWCEQFNLNSDFSTQKCDKCCESNFQCR